MSGRQECNGGFFTACARRMGVPGHGLAVFVSALMPAAHGMAQGFPVKPIRLVVPFPAGSTTDIVSRMVGHKLADIWGQPVIVDNRAGAGGIVGTLAVARAPADGYTMLMGGTATHAITPHLERSLEYDAIKDFSAISLVATTPYLLVINPAVSAGSVKELIALARARPGALNYASGGNGSAPHLTAAIFASMTNINVRHVPYKGSAPAIVDLLGGQVQIIFTGIPSVLAHVRASRLKALAVTSARRNDVLPELPTVAEAGVAGYDVSPWFGLLAPTKTPPAIVNVINGSLVRVLATPDLQERLRGEGVELGANSPQQFGTFIRTEMTKWGLAVKQSGMTLD